MVIDQYDLLVAALYRYSFTQHFYFFSPLSAAVATSGEESLVTWFNGHPDRGGTVVAARVDRRGIGAPFFVGLFGPDIGSLEKPAIAWDGERYLVAWQDKLWYGNHDISAAAIDANGVANFSVTATDAEEQHPTVLAIEPGRFLVTYQSTTGGRSRIAGRFIDFRGPRRRVAK